MNEGIEGALEGVIAEQPAHADALCMLGVALNDFGPFAEAKGAFERALAVRPSFPELARYETGDLAAAAARGLLRRTGMRRGPNGLPNF